MNNTPIYTITMLQYAASGRRRCVGFFYDILEAIKAVKTNELDIRECDHWYCVIEEITEGIFCYPRKEMWFRWENISKNEGYKECNKPDHLKNVIGFGVG